MSGRFFFTLYPEFPRTDYRFSGTLCWINGRKNGWMFYSNNLHRDILYMADDLCKLIKNIRMDNSFKDIDRFLEGVSSVGTF